MIIVGCNLLPIRLGFAEANMEQPALTEKPMNKTGKTFDDDLLTIADMARHFGLPESTARYYCKRFAAFMPSVGNGRRRRYRPQALAVVEAILDGMQDARNAASVETLLANRFPRNTEALPVALAPGTVAPSATPSPLGCDTLPAAAMLLIDRQTAALESIAATLHALAARQNEITRIVSHVCSSENDTAALRQEVDTLRLLLDASEKTQQQDLEQLRTWLGRIIAAKRGAPPA